MHEQKCDWFRTYHSSSASLQEHVDNVGNDTRSKDSPKSPHLDLLSQPVEAVVCSKREVSHQQELTRQNQQHAEELAALTAKQSAHDKAFAAQQQAHCDELAARSNLLDEVLSSQDKAFNFRLEGLQEEHTKAQTTLHLELEAASNERVELCRRHQAAKREWEVMQKRRNVDGKMFSYTVRGCEGPHLSGTVPRQIFEAEPDSALAQIYNGEWEYARDEQGRAVVNSNPAIWPIIIDWLSFGTVPEKPSNQLIAECRYWQLRRFLTALEVSKTTQQGDEVCSRPHVQAQEGSHHFCISKVCTATQAGFRITGHICDFGRLARAALAAAISIYFDAVGRTWHLVITRTDCKLSLVKGDSLVLSGASMHSGTFPQQTGLVGDFGPNSPGTKDMTFQAGGSFRRFALSEAMFKEMSHPRVLEADGSIQLALKYLFDRA